MRFFIFALLGLLPFSVFGQHMVQDTFLLFYLGGQSNMSGFGLNDELPTDLRGEYVNTYIFQGNPVGDENPAGGLGLWAPLTPGHGGGFTSDGTSNTLSSFFGLELTFAKTWQNYFPGQKVALIKYARGGSSIDSTAARDYGCWEPDFQGKNGLNQYDHFLTTLRSAFSQRDINSDGRPDILKPAGILWMQGESDAAFDSIVAERYYDHLKRLMDLLRAAFLQDDLPVIIGRISDSGLADGGTVWPYGARVRQAQADFVKHDERAALVSETDNLTYSDPAHYDTDGYIKLGKAFAEAMIRIWEK
ncbi:MAG: hypothetical protein HRU40_18060 [Saprospiraceae bacterium]|nr:hypothetical protein [Saprospiraceae bacterium]